MFKSFRVQVALSFGSLALIIVLAMSIMIDRLLTRQLTQDQGEALQTLAHSIGAMLGDGLHERSREITLLAQSADIVQSRASAEDIGRVLERVQRTRRHYSWIGLATPAGRVLASTGGMLLGKDVSTRPWFREAQQRPFVGDVHEAKLLAQSLPNTDSREPQRFVDFAAPVRGVDGKPIGVLGAHANWGWVRDVIETLRSQRARDKGVLVFVLNAKGQVIHRPQGPHGLIDPAEGQTLPSDYAMTPWSDGQRYLTATAPLITFSTDTSPGWKIVVRQPEALALYAAMRVRQTMLPMSLAASLLAMLVAWRMAHKLSRPLALIAVAARRIQHGDLHSHLPQTQSSSELRDLSDALSRMTDSLQRHQQELEAANASLEERVRLRTDELQRANAELTILARRDGLTGLFNRRAAEDRLHEEGIRHQRSRQTMSLIMIDIDHFKKINDRFGHAAGDAALQSAALCLERHCRGSDFVARFGGEEFLVLLPDTAIEGALHTAEKLRQAVAALDVPSVGRISISLGIASSSPESRLSQIELLKFADEALYMAKARGRNQVVGHGVTVATVASTDTAHQPG